MQNKSSSIHKYRFDTADSKLLITTLSLTAAVGLWGLFANENQNQVANFSQTSLDQAQLAVRESLDLPPIPTLMPLTHDLNTNALQPLRPDTEANSVFPELRDVTAPTPIIIQKQAPIVESVTLSGPAASPADSGSGSSSPQPITSTSSSK